ncbi:MAG: sigma 54-interacting transcriptional regulator [Proteobacteria bacterium]|nr:sigma 54-interacting transcriptional regulator [Pseudomonadota bacterium]
MPHLSVEHLTREKREHALYKKITTIGASEDNDICCVGFEIEPAHAVIYLEGDGFQIEPVSRRGEVYLNGKRIKKKSLLAHHDALRLGLVEAQFSLYDASPKVVSASEDDDVLSAFRMLRKLAGDLSQDYTVGELLDHVMDDVVDLVSADKGFLIIIENGKPSVKVARNLNQETLLDAHGQISDSIVEHVLQMKEPLIVSDALHDSQFNASLSVVNLRLCSIMCLPLLDRGRLIGIVYVGNDNVVNLFQPRHLEVLKIFGSQIALILANAILVDDLTIRNRSLESELEALKFGNVIGNCFAMREVFHTVEKVAATDVTVLIEGETGTGKELIAHELHRRSNRARGPFIDINCGAIPGSLLESELFGHVRGAFTGAIQTKPGKFQQANGGTLFLDEIGEMPQELQVKLLRVLQERRVMKVGAGVSEEVDIRIVAATNKRLEQEVSEGRFREDLFYRLNVISLKLPPLRERGDDVLLIAGHLLERYAKDLNMPPKVLSPEAVIAVRKYTWPGNIRQLENRLKKGLILSERGMIGPEDLDLMPEVLRAVVPLAEAKEEFQRRYINEILELNNGNRTKAARDLGVDPRTIFRHLEKENER